MDFDLAFPLNTFESARDAFQFISPYLRFEIFRINVSGFGRCDFGVESLGRLNDSKGRQFTLWGTEDDESLNHYLIFRQDYRARADVIIASRFETDQIDFDGLNKAGYGRGSSLGIMYDGEKAFWQSISIINTYQRLKRPYAHLPRRLNLNMPPFMQEEIDIFPNPGHKVLTYETFLMAAPQMWFGPGIVKYFDKSKLLSFPELITARYDSTDSIYIHLFDEHVDDYEDEEIMGLQNRFRDWTGMNDVERRLNYILTQL